MGDLGEIEGHLVLVFAKLTSEHFSTSVEEKQGQNAKKVEVTWADLRRVLGGLLVLLGLLGWGGWWISSQLPDGKARMWVLDIGQGSAAVFQGKDGATAIFDGGPDDSLLVRLGEILPFWERKIDLVIVTHPHADHFWGLLDLIDRWEIGQLVIPNVVGGDAGWKDFLEKVEENGVKVNLARADQDWRLDEWTTVDVLWPFDDEVFRVRNHNDASVVVKLEVCENAVPFEMVQPEKESENCKSVLVTGDTEKKGEERLVESGENLKAEVLILGHHGSKTSSGTGFLSAVNPEMAVISVGAENSFGHPDGAILERVGEFVGEENLHRTDVSGTIEVLF